MLLSFQGGKQAQLEEAASAVEHIRADAEQQRQVMEAQLTKAQSQLSNLQV